MPDPLSHTGTETDAAHAGAHGLQIERVGMERISAIRRLNTTIFNERRIINTFDREDLLMLLASLGGEPVGFKIGYCLRSGTYYSAKGGVLPRYRRQGIARALLFVMMNCVRDWGYRAFTFDTFPNKHPGMTILGLSEGFRVVKAGYNAQYDDYRLRFEKEL